MAEVCLVSVLGRVCPLDLMKCCFEITSCSELQNVLNLLTLGMSSVSLMGNIKYRCRPRKDALGEADVGSDRLRGRHPTLHPTEEENRPPELAGQGEDGGGGCPGCVSATLRGAGGSVQGSPLTPASSHCPPGLKPSHRPRHLISMCHTC